MKIIILLISILWQTHSTECESWQLSVPEHFRNRAQNCYISPPGEGGLCKCMTIQKVDYEPITIYRMFDQVPDFRLRARIDGSYWGFENPEDGSEQQYRVKFDVCQKWNDLLYLVNCQVPFSTIFQIGFGQSAVCTEEESYPQSESIQIRFNGFPDDFFSSCSWKKVQWRQEIDL